jgi:hypothetical protein
MSTQNYYVNRPYNHSAPDRKRVSTNRINKHSHRIRSSGTIPCEQCTEPITFRMEVIALSGKKIPSPVSPTPHYYPMDKIRRVPVLHMRVKCKGCTTAVFYNDEKQPIELSTCKPRICKIKPHLIRDSNGNHVKYQLSSWGEL